MRRIGLVEQKMSQTSIQLLQTSILSDRVELVYARGWEEVHKDQLVRQAQNGWLMRLLTGHTRGLDEQGFRESYLNE